MAVAAAAMETDAPAGGGNRPSAMTTAYIALGSNLGNPVKQVTTAVAEIAALATCRLVAQSHWYRTAPLGPGQQPDYTNGVVAVDTSLDPLALLHELQAIEQAHGRQRGERWGPRTLDLDLLLFGQETIATLSLVVPHPRLRERNFVLYPLADIAPGLVMPNGISITSLLENTASGGIVRLTEGNICGNPD